jgi:hypothetical protein
MVFFVLDDSPYGWREADWRGYLDRWCRVTIGDLLVLVPCLLFGAFTLFTAVCIGVIVAIVLTIINWDPDFSTTLFRICPKKESEE